ncbi:unnamed protein product [Colias eurytheme]|nr:unnamed protein product [Colias eurytheme]
MKHLTVCRVREKTWRLARSQRSSATAPHAVSATWLRSARRPRRPATLQFARAERESIAVAQARAGSRTEGLQSASQHRSISERSKENVNLVRPARAA